MDENIKSYVVDASFILSYLLPDEETDLNTQKLFELFKKGEVVFCAPHIISFEICNSLKTAVIRKRLTLQQAQKLIKVFLKYGVLFELTDLPKTFLTAHKYNITFYDASYIQLAKANKAPLLTLDMKMKQILR